MLRYIVILSLAITSCGGQPPTPAPVAQREWKLVGDPGITLRYSDGRFAGNSGCNQYSGPVTAGTGDAIKVGSLVSTRRACTEEARNRAEAQFLERLAAVTAMRTEANKLTLTYRLQNENGTLEFVPNVL